MGKEIIKAESFVFMYDLKLFCKSEQQTYTLVRTAHVFSTNIRMTF